jgi:hypothetical protein
MVETTLPDGFDDFLKTLLYLVIKEVFTKKLLYITLIGILPPHSAQVKNNYPLL